MANDFTSETNLQAQWRFESGALTTDTSGKGNTLTSYSAGSDTGDYKEGGCSLDLLRTTPQYMTIADASLSADFPWANDGSSMTGSFCVWFKADAINADDTIFSKWTTGGNARQIRFSFGTGGTFRLEYSSAGTASTVVALYNSGAVQTGRWYHVGFTWNNSTKEWQLRIWDDTAGSVIVNESGTAGSTIAQKTAAVRIGYYLDGHVDECLVFNRVLTTTEIDQLRSGTFPNVATTITPDKQDLTWTQNDSVPITINLPAKQDLTWTVNDGLPIVAGVPDAQALTWELKEPIGEYDAFRKTAADEWTSTADDTWAIQDAIIDVNKQELTWTLNEVVFAESLDVNVDEQTLTWTVNAALPAGLVAPDKQDLTWTVQACNPTVTYVSDSEQTLTWEIQEPTVGAGISKTVYPSNLTLTWSLRTGISLGTGDAWTDTDSDKWSSFQDQWQFATTAIGNRSVQVDKLTLTWAVSAVTSGLDKVVYPYEYLKDENGFPVLDEAGNPIETAKSVLEATWSVNDDVTISKLPQAVVTPNGLNLTWELKSTVLVQVANVPDAFALTYTLNDGVPNVYVFPEKSDATWSQPTHVFLDDITNTPDKLDLTWTVNSARVQGVLGKSKRKGLLLGVYGS